MTVEIWLTASSFNPFSVGDLLDLIDQVEWLLLRLSFFVRLAQDMLSYLFNACDGLLDERRSDDDAHDNRWIPRAEESRSYEPRNSLLGWFSNSKITTNLIEIRNFWTLKIDFLCKIADWVNLFKIIDYRYEAIKDIFLLCNNFTSVFCLTIKSTFFDVFDNSMRIIIICDFF